MAVIAAIDSSFERVRNVRPLCSLSKHGLASVTHMC